MGKKKKEKAKVSNLELHALAGELKAHGYEIEYEDGDNHKSWYVRGHGIRGAFCEPNDQSYAVLNGRFAADNSKCFDKWSKCPLVMKLPCDTEKLVKHLKFLGSKEGYKHSNGYEYHDNPILPMEVEH